MLGITNINYIAGGHHLAVVHAILAGTPAEEVTGILGAAAAATSQAQPQPANAQAPPAQAAASGASASGEVVQVSIDNFAFTPRTLTIRKGASVAWTNHDDIPHTVDQNDRIFSSPVLDTDQKFQ